MMRQGGNGQIKRYFRKMEIDQSTIYTLYASKVSDHYRQLLKERVGKVLSGEILATRRLTRKVDRSASDTALRRASEDNYYRDRVGSSLEAHDVVFSTGPMGMTIANDHMHRAVVSKVVIDGPADHAGVLVGDCITSIDGISTEDYEHVMQLIINGPRPISLRFSRLVRQTQQRQQQHQRQQQQISRSRSLLFATSLVSTSDDANDDFVINADAIDIEALDNAAQKDPPIYIQDLATSTTFNMKGISSEDRAVGQVIVEPCQVVLDDTSNQPNKDISLVTSGGLSITAGPQPTMHSIHSSSSGWGFHYHDHDYSEDSSSSTSDEYHAMMRMDIKTAFDKEVNGDDEFSALQAESLTPTPNNNVVIHEETSDVTATAAAAAANRFGASSVQDSTDSVDVQSDIEYLEKIASLLLITELGSDHITPEFTPQSSNDSKFFESSSAKSHASSGKVIESDEYMEFTVVYREGPIGLTVGYITSEGTDNGRIESLDRQQEQSLLPRVTDVVTGGQSELLGVVVGDLLSMIGMQVVNYCYEEGSMQQLLLNSTFPLHVKFRRKKL